MEVIANITDFFVKLSIIFVGLLAFTHLLYLRFFRKVRPDSQSSQIVMGLGLFLLACLPQLQVPYLTITVLALELAILWVYLLVSYALVLEKNPKLISQGKNQTYLGCWVIATLVLAILLDQLQPLLHGAILLLLLVAGLVWLFFAIAVTVKIFKWLARKYYASITFDCLLLAISILLVHLLAYELFAELISSNFYYACVIISVVMFALGFAVMLNEQRQQFVLQGLLFRDHHSLIYGYLAILGYSLVETNIVAENWEIFCWWLAVCSLMLIEGVRLRTVSCYIIKQLQNRLPMDYKYQRHFWLTVFSLAAFFMFALNYYYQLRPDSYIAYYIVLVLPFILLGLVLYQLTLNLMNIHKNRQ